MNSDDALIDRVHRDAVIIDAHNDSFCRRLEKGDDPSLHSPAPRYHVDLPRLHQGGLTAMFTYIGGSCLHRSMELWEALYAQVEAAPDDFTIIQTHEDVLRAKESGMIGLVAQLESCACLGGCLRILGVLHRMGLRVANLTHGEGLDRHDNALQVDSSPFAYCTAQERDQARREMRGLTDFGREVIAFCNAHGIIVDTAHANDTTFYETLEASDDPVIFSHGCVFAVCPHWRGLTDDQIRALAAHGGVMGVAFYRTFIHQHEPSMERLLDQVEHVINLVGADHVGIGADFDGLPDDAVPIPPDVGRLPELTAAMLARGFDEATVRKVLGENFLRVCGKVWNQAPGGECFTQ